MNTEKLSKIEKEFIRGCKKQKLKYQEKLYKHFYSYAMSICLRYSYSEEEAGEVLNDSFMKVFTKIDKYDENLSFKSWFRRIIINTSIDYYRKNSKHRQNTDIEDAIHESDNYSAIEQMSAEDILQLLDQLSTQYRIVFNLYEIEGYSHEEIGKMLNISASTSRTNLTRAKKKLKMLYHKFFAEKKYERVF